MNDAIEIRIKLIQISGNSRLKLVSKYQRLLDAKWMVDDERSHFICFNCYVCKQLSTAVNVVVNQ